MGPKNSIRFRLAAAQMYQYTSELKDKKLIIYSLDNGLVENPKLPSGIETTIAHQEYDVASEYFPIKAQMFLNEHCPHNTDLFYIQKISDKKFEFGFICK